MLLIPLILTYSCTCFKEAIEYTNQKHLRSQLSYYIWSPEMGRICVERDAVPIQIT